MDPPLSPPHPSITAYANATPTYSLPFAISQPSSLTTRQLERGGSSLFGDCTLHSYAPDLLDASAPSVGTPLSLSHRQPAHSSTNPRILPVGTPSPIASMASILTASARGRGQTQQQATAGVVDGEEARVKGDITRRSVVGEVSGAGAVCPIDDARKLVKGGRKRRIEEEKDVGPWLTAPDDTIYCVTVKDGNDAKEMKVLAGTAPLPNSC